MLRHLAGRLVAMGTLAVSLACGGPIEHVAAMKSAPPRPALLGTGDGALLAVSHEGGSFVLELSGGEVHAITESDEPAFRVGERVFRVHSHGLQELLPGGRGGRADKDVLSEQLAWESAAVRAELEAQGRLSGNILLRVTRHTTKAGVPFVVWDYAFPSEDGEAPGAVYAHLVKGERLLSLATPLKDLDDGDKSREALIALIEAMELREGPVDLSAEQQRLDERERARSAAALEPVVAKCKGGSAAACTDLGYRFLFGNNGATEDHAKARDFLQQGCDRGEPRGCLGLAGMYVTALGVQKDLKRGKALLRRGCKLGLKQACTSLEQLNSE